jgi:uncharacterized protein YcgL (UPF0745 family)
MITTQQPYDKGATSELVDFRGKVRYVQAVNLNKFGKWSIQFYPDNESLEALRKLQAQGIKNVMKIDDDGYHLQISRPPQVEFQKGVITPLTAPKVRDKDKNPLDGRTVGDSSDCIVTCEVYTHRVPNTDKRAKAMRFYGLTVLELVPREVPEEKEDEPTAGWE